MDFKNAWLAVLIRGCSPELGAGVHLKCPTFSLQV